jgi:dienelactone hydrolase
VAAIDGPFHGERVDRYLPPAEYQERIVSRGVERVIDEMVADWLAAIAAIVDQYDVREDSVAYLGMSMAARFGLALAAASGPRLRCAVLGKFGLVQSGALNKGLDMPWRYADYARQVTIPVLYQILWDDEVFPRDGQLALFDLLGSPEKHLRAWPGAHATKHAGFDNASLQFLTQHLAVGVPS